MRPASSTFAAAISGSYELATSVEVLSHGDVVHTVTETIGGTVTLDQAAQTRGRLDLELIDDGTLDLIPTSPDSLLAPYGNELRVRRGITFPDGTAELVGLGVFRIDRVAPSDTAAGTRIVIAARDRSARIIDARFEEPYQVAASTNYATAIETVLQDAWPGIETDFAATTRTTPELFAEEGSDRWQFAQEMATAIGMSLYFDGDGVCVLRPVSAVDDTAVLSLAEGDDGVLVEAAREWSREGGYNRVIATGENTGETAPARGVATDDNPLSPTYYYGPFGRVPRFYASQFITTNAQAEDAARAMLARELGTTQSVTFGALVDPRLEPDDVVAITRARMGMSSERHVIDQITIPLAAASAMTGRTRATMVVSE